MSFKDQIEADLDLLFNLEEFAELHTINGVQLSIVIDNDELKKRQTESEYGYEGKMLFYVAKSAIDEVPAVQEIMTFDNEKYMVTDVQETAGLLTITLGANMG